MEKFKTILAGLGFTEYEILAYLALLEKAPRTPYELSESAEIPRGIIFATLSKLVEQGVVHEVLSPPGSYIPLDPREFVDLLKEDFAEQLTALSLEIEHLPHPQFHSFIRTIPQRRMVIRQLTAMVRHTRRELLLMQTGGPLEALTDPLQVLSRSGIPVVLVADREAPADLPLIQVEPGMGGAHHWYNFILIRDDRDLYLGYCGQEELQESRGFWTRNRWLLGVLKEYITLRARLAAFQRAGLEGGLPEMERLLLEKSGLIDNK